MFKYLTTKNIENYRYDISILKNRKDIDSKDETRLLKAEKIIEYSKYICRVYLSLECLNFIYRAFILKSNKNRNSLSFVYIFIRVNIIWLISNIYTSCYLDKNIPALIKKYNHDLESDKTFKKYITNKY